MGAWRIRGRGRSLQQLDLGNHRSRIVSCDRTPGTDRGRRNSSFSSSAFAGFQFRYRITSRRCPVRVCFRSPWNRSSPTGPPVQGAGRVRRQATLVVQGASGGRRGGGRHACSGERRMPRHNPIPSRAVPGASSSRTAFERRQTGESRTAAPAAEEDTRGPSSCYRPARTPRAGSMAGMTSDPRKGRGQAVPSPAQRQLRAGRRPLPRAVPDLRLRVQAALAPGRSHRRAGRSGHGGLSP